MKKQGTPYGSSLFFLYLAWDEKNYSPLFIDLYDSSNQKLLQCAKDYPYPSETTGYVNDQICIPNILAIQEIAYRSPNIDGVKTLLKEAKVGYSFTDQDVDIFFQSFKL